MPVDRGNASKGFQPEERIAAGRREAPVSFAAMHARWTAEPGTLSIRERGSRLVKAFGSPFLVLGLLTLLPTLALSKDKAEPTPFDTPERVVEASPAGPASLALGAGESVVDYEVSPAGGLVALEVKGAPGYDVRLWKMGEGAAPVAWKAPAGMTLKGLTWHPAKEGTLFLLAA